MHLRTGTLVRVILSVRPNHSYEGTSGEAYRPILKNNGIKGNVFALKAGFTPLVSGREWTPARFGLKYL